MATAVPSSGASKNVPWYIPDGELVDFGSDVLAVFEQYSHIPAAEVRAHILQVAWQVIPFPCIGQARFIDFSLAAMPSYATVLARLRDAATESRLLDVGCCFGQDLRRLAADGAPSARLVGLELEARFVELGWQLFRDREQFQGAMVVGDVLDAAPDSSVGQQLTGQIDIVHAASFFHLFDWAGQVAAARAIVRLLRPDRRDALVLGRQLGAIEAHARPYPTDITKMQFMHNPQSFQRLWDEVGAQTNTKWRVNAWLQDTATHSTGAGPKWMGNKVKLLYFEVQRVEGPGKSDMEA